LAFYPLCSLKLCASLLFATRYVCCLTSHPPPKKTPSHFCLANTKVSWRPSPCLWSVGKIYLTPSPLKNPLMALFISTTFPIPPFCISRLPPFFDLIFHSISVDFYLFSACLPFALWTVLSPLFSDLEPERSVLYGPPVPQRVYYAFSQVAQFFPPLSPFAVIF